MRVKITTSCSGLKFSYSAGEIADVKKDIGEELVAIGFAKEIKESKPTVKKETKSKTDSTAKMCGYSETKVGDDNADT